MALPSWIAWDEFKRKYPKFGNLSQTRIEQALEDAQLYVGEAQFGIRYQHAVEVKAAALLEGDKYGQQEGLKDESAKSEYQKKWIELCRMVPVRCMVT